MQWFEDAWRASNLPRPVAATIGNYDGVHRGQQAILDTLVERARTLGVPAVVVTFEPHPLTVVAPQRAPRRLASRDQKRELLASAGIDAVVEIRFDAVFAETAAVDFVRQFLIDKLQVRAVLVGSEFQFGRGQTGDLALLEELGAARGFEARGVPEVAYLASPISSSRIRAAVAEGDLVAAREMLGRPFALRGRIMHGERRGRGLGWPTINLMPEQEVIPAKGVYVTEVRLMGESATRSAVTNVGVRPTVSAGIDLVVESHILDFSRDVYDMEAEVEFLQRLRDEQAFESIEALSKQIQHDVRRARAFFAERTTVG